MNTPTITTEQFAKTFHIQPNTIRSKYCKDGHVYGIKPTKLPNRRLLWPLKEVEALLNKEVSA